MACQINKLCLEILHFQGIVKEDPIHIGEAVFASALPPRQKEPLSQEDSTKLRKLLQSKNPEDLKVNSCDYCLVSLCCFGLFDDVGAFVFSEGQPYNKRHGSRRREKNGCHVPSPH